MAAKTSSNEIKLTRIYDAPLRTVWDAWNEPDQAAQWWGPRGFTLTTHSKDLKVGGTWHYTMHGPDGIDYVNKTKYLEIEKFAKLVYDHGGNDEQKPMFRVTVLFKEVAAGKTRMDMTMALPTPEAAEQTRGFIKKANGNSTWDRLAEYLERNSSAKEIFVINRSFEAPVERMFELWTDQQHIARWMGPTGSTMEFLKADIRPGGSSFYRMTMGPTVMYGRAEYLQFEKPRRIVYRQQFCDEKERPARHPLAPTWPETMQTTVVFTEEGPGQTLVTITWEVVGGPTPEEMATFTQGRTGMTGGWNGSFDKLEEYLVSQGGVK